MKSYVMTIINFFAVDSLQMKKTKAKSMIGTKIAEYVGREGKKHDPISRNAYKKATI